MPDYEKMYFELFNATTKTIEALKEAQRRAEELYLSGGSGLCVMGGKISKQ